MMEFLQRFDEQIIEWHPDGPAPVGVAAKKAVLRFGGPVADFVCFAAAIQPVRFAFVHLGQGAQTVVAQKFSFVQRPPEQAFHAMPAQQREQPAFAGAAHLPARNQFGQFGAMIQKPVHPARKVRQFPEQRRFQHFHGKQRNQTDHGTHLQRHGFTVRQAKVVVVKLVLLVPQTERTFLDAIDGGGDAEKMLKEFGGDVLVDAVVPGQFQRDAQQVQTIHRHPARAVGLIDESAGRQRFAAVEHADVVESQETALKNVPALRVLAVDPPGEIEQQLVKNAFEKGEVAGIICDFFDAVVCDPSGTRATRPSRGPAG